MCVAMYICFHKLYVITTFGIRPSTLSATDSCQANRLVSQLVCLCVCVCVTVSMDITYKQLLNISF